ncbi:MAG: putative ABC transporter permease [Bacilli bacterium]|nr:putative ABC transporter permease [Bacilli bacterium]
MQYKVVLNLLFIFILYSFLGWLLEVITVIVKKGEFVNRGVTNGPVCTIYGLAALIITIVTNSTPSLLAIFISGIVYGSAIELIAGKLLERVNKNKWWDYSNKKLNLDGYICLRYSLIWGLLSIILVKIANPLFLFLFNSISLFLRGLIVFILLGIIIVDFITSFVTLKSLKENKIEDVTNRFGNAILKHVLKRLEKAYPNLQSSKKVPKKRDDKKFAKGTSFYKLFLVFIIGGTIGDIVEVIYCYFSMGYFMSRSSVVWGEFSIVWGFAFALATLLLSRYQNRSNTYLFFFGSIMGGSFEYICSVFTEFFFGTVFWDYSKIPFNVNGRINLLFCFFWGFATVIFIKLVYPFLSKLIESIPKKGGTIVTNVLVVFVALDLLVTGCAMLRYNNRLDGKAANNKVEELCDTYFNDEYMRSRWKNMKIKKN